MNTLNDSKPSEDKAAKLNKVKQITDDNESFFAFRNKIINRYKNSVNSLNQKVKNSKSPNKPKTSQTILYESEMTDTFMREILATISNSNPNQNRKSNNSPLLRTRSPIITKKKNNNIQRQLSLLQGEIGTIAKNHYSVINTPMLTLNNNPTMNMNSSTIAVNYSPITPSKNIRQNSTEVKKQKMYRNCSGPNILHSIHRKVLVYDSKKVAHNEVAKFKSNLWV